MLPVSVRLVTRGGGGKMMAALMPHDHSGTGVPDQVADVIVERKSNGIKKSLGLFPENINGSEGIQTWGRQVK